MKIFVVEDNLFYQEMIVNHFNDKKYEVLPFTSGEDMLLSKQNPSLIILDYHLAGQLNGLDVLHRLSNKEDIPPVIFLSAQEDIEVAVDSLKQGAFDYIIKDENAFDHIDAAITRFLYYLERQKKRNNKKLFSKITKR